MGEPLGNKAFADWQAKIQQLKQNRVGGPPNKPAPATPSSQPPSTLSTSTPAKRTSFFSFSSFHYA